MKRKEKTLPSLALSGQTVEDYGSDPYCETCKVGPWGNYTNCSVSCGGGIQFRYRNITQQPTCNNTCPPLSQNKTCNTQPCQGEKFTCQKGNCFCLANKTQHLNTTQAHPAVPTIQGCAGFNVTYNSTWGFDAVCNNEQICYSTCNVNKTTCDIAFLAGLKAACENLTKGPSQVACLKTIPQFSLATHSNASLAEFNANQTSHCSCPNTTTTKYAKKWDDSVRDSFEKFLTNFCNSHLNQFKTFAECKEKASELLLDKTKFEEESEKKIQESIPLDTHKKKSKKHL